MAAPPRVTPSWLIDSHGMIEALTTTKNSIRVAVIDAIQNGSMLVLKSVSNELKEAYPDIYIQLQAINPRKYLTPTVSMIASAATLAETHGSSLLGSIPSASYFLAVAAAQMSNCKLVSHGKGLTHCSAIAKKCQLASRLVQPLNAV